MSNPRSAFLAGIRAELPILLGVIPFGIIYGALALEAGLSTSAAMAMSSIIFAGSAQFISVQLFKDQAAWFVILATVFVVNLRHMLYSASIQPHIAHLPQRWKWFLAYLLTDEAYAVAIMKYNDTSEATHKHWYFLGAGLALWTTWQLSTLLGILLRAQARLDPRLGLDFAIAVTFIALVVPALKDRAITAAALVAGTISVIAVSLAGYIPDPTIARSASSISLIVATFVGIIVGMIVEGRPK
jgi:4-azaleucine resistance transporter AzlC